MTTIKGSYKVTVTDPQGIVLDQINIKQPSTGI